ncbi:tyrosine-type recombinase/integrase [Halochromatium glycolicum]|uniref:tyrosine-type recombinase/integrase n=1 Tax=Halochromatium glycolicum TaxID=85075 RepID=UPI00190AEB35|nr:tyrosine-type recombinase/integrase [Halochromatium glycolicum]
MWPTDHALWYPRAGGALRPKSSSRELPSLASKRVSPHSIRHTTAVFLLRAGVDINTIRAWLGHASINTTHVYAEFDLEMKAKALAKCALTGDTRPGKHWADDASLMGFLQSL